MVIPLDGVSAPAPQPYPSIGYGARAGLVHSAVQKSAAASQLKVPSVKLPSKSLSGAQLRPGTPGVVVGAAVLDAGAAVVEAGAAVVEAGAAVVEEGAVVEATAENGYYTASF